MRPTVSPWLATCRSKQQKGAKRAVLERGQGVTPGGLTCNHSNWLIFQNRCSTITTASARVDSSAVRGHRQAPFSAMVLRENMKRFCATFFVCLFAHNRHTLSIQSYYYCGHLFVSSCWLAVGGRRVGRYRGKRTHDHRIPCCAPSRFFRGVA